MVQNSGNVSFPIIPHVWHHRIDGYSWNDNDPVTKYKQIKSIAGKTIQFQPKEKGVKRYLFGRIIFGFGWALTGSCPGPMFTLVGNGFSIILVSIACAILGTYTYGYFKDKLPH